MKCVDRATVWLLAVDNWHGLPITPETGHVQWKADCRSAMECTGSTVDRSCTCELQHPVKAGSVFRPSLRHASGPLQVSLDLVLNFQLAHAPPGLQMMEVYQLIWLGMGMGVLRQPKQ